MHSQLYHDRVNADLLDPNGDGWERIAHRRFHYLIEKIGESDSERWLDVAFPDGSTSTWKELALATSIKLAELTAAALTPEAANDRIDRQMQAHPGIV